MQHSDQRMHILVIPACGWAREVMKALSQSSWRQQAVENTAAVRLQCVSLWPYRPGLLCLQQKWRLLKISEHVIATGFISECQTDHSKFMQHLTPVSAIHMRTFIYLFRTVESNSWLYSWKIQKWKTVVNCNFTLQMKTLLVADLFYRLDLFTRFNLHVSADVGQFCVNPASDQGAAVATS